MKKINYFLALLLVIIILLLNFRILVFNQNFYEKISENNENFNKEYNLNLINYLRNKEKLNTNIYTERETLHLSDVKSIINKSILLLYLISILLILLSIKYYKDILEVLFISGILNIILIVIIIIVNFNNLFYNFHLFFFNNDLWLLNKDTILIKMFPEIFFKNFFHEILLRSFLISLFLFLVSIIFTKIKR